MQLREEKIRAGKGNTQLERGRKERHKKKISIFLFSQLSKYCEQRLLCGLICCTKPAEITKDGCWRRFSQRCLLSALRRFFLASKHFILCSLELNFEALQHWKSCILSTQKKEKEGEVWLSGTGTTFPNAEIIYSSTDSDLLTQSSADVMKYPCSLLLGPSPHQIFMDQLTVLHIIMVIFLGCWESVTVGGSRSI